MEFLIRLLKDWTDPSGKSWTKGQTLKLNDREIAGQLILDGLGEKVSSDAVISDTNDPNALGGIVDAAVKSSIEAKMDEIGQSAARHVVDIQVRDNDDDNQTHGYLPAKKSYTDHELNYGMGLFAADVYRAGDSFSNASETLKKSFERSRNVIEKGYSTGTLKAAGDGIQARVDNEAGALIPPAFSTMLLDAAAETAVIRPRASVIPIGGLSIVLPKVKDYNRSTGIVHGGVLAYWRGEDAQLTESKPDLEEIQLNLHALTVLAYASHQSLRFSAVDLGAFLLPKMADAITFKEEDVFLNGTGAGMPLGILNAPARRSITAESGQTSSANVIVIQNIDNAIARIHVMRPGSTIWMYNRPQLYNWLVDLKRTVGTGGEIERIFRFGGFAAGNQSNLAGIPIQDSEHIPAAATEGDLLLTDWSQYLIADDRAGAESAQSIHLKFDYAQTAWRIIKYTDAQPINSTFFTRHKGSVTTSSIMTIATRT